MKENVKKLAAQTESVRCEAKIASPSLVDLIQEESSDVDDFTLVMSKKKAREKRKLKLSSIIKKIDQTQEAPGLQTRGGTKTTKPPISKKTKLGKNDITRFSMEQ